MTRNYGIPVVTNRQASGDQPPAGPHTRADTQRDSNVVYLFSEDSEPTIHPLELGSCFLLLAFLSLPAVILGGLTVGYLLFVSKPI